MNAKSDYERAMRLSEIAAMPDTKKDGGPYVADEPSQHVFVNGTWRTLDWFEATLHNDDPPRGEGVTEIQHAETWELLCYANPDRALYIVQSCNAHDELVAALAHVARGPCEDQRNGDKCICSSCTASAALAKVRP